MENLKKETSTALLKFISEGTCPAIIERYASLSEISAKSYFGELDEDIVVLDTETTGFSFSHDELIQIAAARMRKGEITDWYVCFVNPGRPIPEDIVNLTGISDEDVADAPQADEALRGLVSFVGDSSILAHNADFDRNFTTKYAAGSSLSNNTWIDSLDLARIVLPRFKSHRQVDLAHAFEAPASTHRADADVESLCSLYRIFLAGIQEMPFELCKRISQLAPLEEWPSVKVFQVMSQLREAKEKDTTQEGTGYGKQSETDESTSFDSSTVFGSMTNGNTGSNISLKKLREARIKDIKNKPKLDAEALAEDTKRSLSFPNGDELSNAFDKKGIIGSIYNEYETRFEQVEMSKAIAKAFSSSMNLSIEAGTGVGKSMAYLLPAALSAKNNNITVGVATKTNALLDQLVYKELPLLSEAFNEESKILQKGSVEQKEALLSQTDCVRIDPGGENQRESLEQNKPFAQDIDYASLKGFSHYPCLRLIDKIARKEAGMRSVSGKPCSQAPAIAALLSFVEQSTYDDIDSLKIDFRLLPKYLFTTSSRECLRRKCPFYGKYCFVHGARRAAENADIVVTNQSLLFCDIVAGGGLLPPIRYWIIDEAHGAEDEARRAFSLSVAADEVGRLAAKVASGEDSQNCFIRAERCVGDALDDISLFYSLTSKARAAGIAFDEAAMEFFARLKELSFFDTNKKSKAYEQVEIWINDDIRSSAIFMSLAGYGKTLIDASEKLIKASQEIVGILEDVEGAAEAQRDIASVAIRLKELLDALEIILFKAPPDYAYSVILSKNQGRQADRLEAQPVNVGSKLNDDFFTRTHSVILTSATITVADSFESFENALGLNESEYSLAASKKLNSSFDFDTQMTVYVVNDIPEPNSSGYLAALQSLLIKVHQAQRGSMLTLFTNRREMQNCFDVVYPALKKEDLRLVAQKWGVSAKALRDEFLADEHLSLFALKSFWEGFDAPGSTLKGVIIPKLPFSKPSDPLSRERSLRDDQAWMHYVLPQAIIETKQAAGRLIRNAKDTGVLILADRRLLSKSYGKLFLKSMPSKTIQVCSSTEVAQALSRMHQK